MAEDIVARKHLIYKYTSPSGKAYIGQTNNLSRRKGEHKRHAAAKVKCTNFYMALSKYGYEAFALEILESDLTHQEANDAEIRLIREHGTVSPGGYNLSHGGNSFGVSQETRDRISEACKGRIKTPEHLKNLSASLREASKREEVKKRRSEAKKSQNLKMPDHVKAALRSTNLGRSRSVEERAAMSAGQKVRWAKLKSEKNANKTGF